jgi:hypothetical protein
MGTKRTNRTNGYKTNKSDKWVQNEQIGQMPAGLIYLLVLVT